MNILILGSFDLVKAQVARQFINHQITQVGYGRWEDKKSYYSYDLSIYIEASGKFRASINNPQLFEEPYLSEVAEISRALRELLTPNYKN